MPELELFLKSMIWDAQMEPLHWIFPKIIEPKTHLQIFHAGGGLLILQKPSLLHLFQISW